MEQSTVAIDCQTKDAPAVVHVLDRALESMGISITCFENDVPSFVEAEMERLYGNLYSSLARFRIYGKLKNTSTYVVRKDHDAIAIFLFRREKRTVHVMNELIEIDESEINRFTNYIFAMFKSVAVISFSAIQTDIRKLPFPYQRFNSCENLVITLPGSPQEYLASLGNATRRNIKRYTNKLKRNFPSFSYQFYEKEGATEQHIRDIMRLKLARMADKNKVSGINEEDVDRVLALVKECGGLVGIATIDGRVCGGQISYRVGTNYFMSVIAHDPEYNGYSLGTICCYLTICECITRGGTELHFLWGREEDKYRFLGVQRDLDNLNIFRSSTQSILNSDIALRSAYQAYVRHVRLWLLDPKNRESVISRIAIKSVRYLRNFRRMGFGILGRAKVNISGESLGEIKE